MFMNWTVQKCCGAAGAARTIFEVCKMTGFSIERRDAANSSVLSVSLSLREKFLLRKKAGVEPTYILPGITGSLFLRKNSKPMRMSDDFVQPEVITKVSENIFITFSKDADVPPGKEYRVFRKNQKRFIYNTYGDKTPLDLSTMKWESRDKVVMIVRVLSSRLKSLKPGDILRVYDDARNDERYVFDANHVMVLFDENIFTWEVL